jgi:A/G-specific adenine glycosylase
MLELPSTDWRETDWALAEARAAAPMPAAWRPLPGVVRHTFTHFHLELTVWAGTAASEIAAEAGLWVQRDELDELALPTLMRKAVAHAQSADG